MSTFTEFKEKSTSEKVVLATIEASKRLFTYSLVSGTIYKRSVDNVVSRVKWNDTELTEGSSTSVSSGEFYFDSSTKELYVNNGSDPSVEFITVTFKFFFSTRPVILPNDLDNGFDVEWEGRILSIGNPKSVGKFPLTSYQESPALSLRIISQCFCINSTSGFDG